MKKIIMNLLFLLPLSITLSGQVKFQNNRFANITPQAVIIKDAGEFYSGYGFNESIMTQLKAKISISDAEFIKSSAVESALPKAFSTLDLRNQNRQRFKDLTLYQIATFDDAGSERAVLIAPYADNKKWANDEIIGNSDLVLIFNAKAVEVTESPKKSIRKDETKGKNNDLFISELLKDVTMGMPLADFQKIRPAAVKTEGSDFRLILEEKIGKKGIKDITYYFDNEGNQPFYEIIVEYDNVANRDNAAEKLFGKMNHPLKNDHWVIYKGNADYLTVGWTYESRLIWAGQIPHSEWVNDDMFTLTDNFDNVDFRINKDDNPNAVVNDVVVNKDEPSTPTCVNYAQEIATIFNAGIDLSSPLTKVIEALPNIQKQPETMNFREDYVLTLGNNGVKQVDFIFDKDGDKPLYEMIFEFDNADSTRRLVEMMFGQPNHPSLEDYWVLAKDEKGIVPMIWLFENKMITAVNLPGTEFETDPNFQMPEGFKPKIEKKSADEKPEDNSEAHVEVISTLEMNTFIGEAVSDFEGAKGDAISGKTDQFNSNIAFNGAEQTIIRKNTADKWRMEARFPAILDFADAQTFFESQLTAVQNLEGLEYRLVKKSYMATKNGRTYIWDVQSLDDQPLNVIVKLQLYPTSDKQFAVKIEIGK